MSKDTSGPAFPPMHNPNENVFGLTKREWYAGLAMQGMLANQDITNEYIRNYIRKYIHADAFAIADAMIAEGNK